MEHVRFLTNSSDKVFFTEGKGFTLGNFAGFTPSNSFDGEWHTFYRAANNSSISVDGTTYYTKVIRHRILLRPGEPGVYEDDFMHYTTEVSVEKLDSPIYESNGVVIGEVTSYLMNSFPSNGIRDRLFL